MEGGAAGRDFHMPCFVGALDCQQLDDFSEMGMHLT